MASQTAVVIPYYQEERGILRRAVRSAVSQVGVAGVEIVVVDDGAPVPARDELDRLDLPDSVTLKLIEQPNRGPGAARNRGLDSVHPDTLYVAFLDSDDRWTNDHLCNAHYVLNQGYDLYFSDLWFPNYRTNFFSRQGVHTARHRCLDRGRHLYEMVGNARLDLVGSKNIFHTSTVVYRFSKFGYIRFPEAFYMGEDLTFWMELVSRTNRIAFHYNIECLAGRGIHIFESHGWDSPKAVWRIHHYLKWRKWLSRTVLTDQREIEENRRQIEALRRNFALNVLHEIRNARAFRNPDILAFVMTDPSSLFCIGPVALRVLAEKIRL